MPDLQLTKLLSHELTPCSSPAPLFTIQRPSTTRMSTPRLPPFDISLDAAGLLALADLDTAARRTALTGTSCLLDALVLVPGLHRQQTCAELHRGEHPACAALTTGYVFRVENPATVVFLQKVGRTGCLTSVDVRRREGRGAVVSDWSGASMVGGAMYLLAVLLTVGVLVYVVLVEDWWAVVVLGALILSRGINGFVIRSRAEPGWSGALEPGVDGDLLVLLSQDRWIRIKGKVDDLKAVTSGKWLRDETFLERSLTALATLLVYLDAALASYARQASQMLLIMLLMGSLALLGIVNEATNPLQMHGRVLTVGATSQKYARRLDLAQELTEETGRRDWAIRLGMVLPENKTEERQEESEGLKVM